MSRAAGPPASIAKRRPKLKRRRKEFAPAKFFRKNSSGVLRRPVRLFYDGCGNGRGEEKLFRIGALGLRCVRRPCYTEKTPERRNAGTPERRNAGTPERIQCNCAPPAVDPRPFLSLYDRFCAACPPRQAVARGVSAPPEPFRAVRRRYYPDPTGCLFRVSRSSVWAAQPGQCSTRTSHQRLGRPLGWRLFCSSRLVFIEKDKERREKK